MSWFNRRKEQPATAGHPEQAIAEFWVWWAASKDQIAAAIPGGGLAAWVDTVTHQVHAIHPGLSWEFGPGRRSQHRLIVTAEGNPDLRRLARRWRRAAPDPDATWEFTDMKQPGTLDARLQIAGADVALSEIQVASTRRGTGLDVVVHHPVYATLPEPARHQLSFIALDECLGEEAVELWVGTIDSSTELPPAARPLGELPAVLAEVIADGMPNGEMGWSVLGGELPAGQALVLCLNRLSSVQAPDFDQLVAIQVPYRDHTPEGLPGPGSLPALQAFEDHLVTRINGSGVLVAALSVAGVRTLHFYVDSTTPAAEQLRAATVGWDQGPIKIDTQLDPAWEAVAPFRQ